MVGRRSARRADRRSARWSGRARGGAVRRDRGRGARCRSPRTTTAGNASASSITAPPAPQPMSATAQPARRRSAVPSSSGTTSASRCARFQGSKPRSPPIAPSDAAAVVVVADAGAEALGDRRQCRHRGWELVEQPESGGLVVGVGEHGDRLGRQREPFTVVDRDEAGGRLVVGPLADPPLDETGSLRPARPTWTGRRRRAPGTARAGHRGAPCPTVIAPSSLVNSRNWNCLRASGSITGRGLRRCAGRARGARRRTAS